jgi:hypothetical protein
MWLVRNIDGVLLLYQNKPTRARDGWSGGGLCFVVGDFPLEHVPSYAEQQQRKDAPLQVKLEMKKR